MDTERLEAAKNEIMAELHKDVFLTPKGMIKFVQLFIVICAFAMTTSASGTSTMTIKQGPYGNKTIDYSLVATVHTKYPFVKYDYKYNIFLAPDGTSGIRNFTGPDLAFRDGFQSESKFYVFVGVISFLYVLVAIVCYGWYKKLSKMSDFFEAHFTKVDFLATVGLTFLWFLSVTLWSAGFSALRADMIPTEFVQLIQSVITDTKVDPTKLCPAPKLECIASDSWSKLYGSVIFGYLCVFLFGGNCWYAFKDTEWHAEPEKLGGILQIRTDPVSGPGAGNTAGLDDVNLEAATTRDTAIQPGAI